MSESCLTEPTIQAYLLGELSAAELESVASHLEECPRCDAVAERLDASASDVALQALRENNGGNEQRTATARSKRETPDMIGDYQILSEVGRGGMGVVYHARDVRLNRQAAVKMILAGHFASPEDQMRFSIEGEMLARMRHPNVVQVYETGQHEGHPFLALEWVGGGTLESSLAGEPMKADRAAALVETLAEAVQHAHLNGVIHRDLKPANILLTEDGAPKITDFGLARAVGEHSSLTLTGSVMGTPGYMAPEQAGGNNSVGLTTDVYGLGALLFALLTGRPPFVGAHPSEVVRAVQNDPAPAPSRFQRRIPRDLETVTLRCLEKDPARRYPSAGEVAAELRRWRTGRPIAAKPTPFWEHAWRFALRNPVPSSAAFIVFVSIAGAFLSVERSRRSESAARIRADANLLKAQRGEKIARDAAEAEIAARRLAERREAKMTAEQAILRCETDHISQGQILFRQALELAEKADDRELARAIKINQAAWAKRMPRKLRDLDAPAAGNSIRTVTFFKSGRRLVTAGREDALVRLWDMPDGAMVQADPSPRLIQDSHAEEVILSGDEQILFVAQGDNRIRRLSPETLKPIRPDLLFGFPNQSIGAAAISPSGKWFAAGNGEGQVRLWDLESDRVLDVDLQHASEDSQSNNSVSIRSMRFCGERTLVTASRRAGINIWDIPSGEIRFRFTPGQIFEIAASPDGAMLAVAGDHAATLWSIDDPRTPIHRWPHAARVESIDVSPNGKLVATGDDSGNVYLWELATGELYARTNQSKPLRDLAFAPDSKGLLIGSVDAASSLWSLPEWPVLAETERIVGRIIPEVGFQSDTDSVWAATTNFAQLRQLRDGQLVETPTILPQPRSDFGILWSIAFSSDGRYAVTGGWNGLHSRVWNVATQQSLSGPLSDALPVNQVGFLPDQQAFFTRGKDGEVGTYRWWQITDEQTVRRVGSWTLEGGLCVSPHPDGRRVLVGRRGDLSSLLIDWTTGQPVGHPLNQEVDVTAAVIHADGRTAATGGRDGGVRLWDLDGGRLIGRLGFHSERINAIAWGPGDSIATASDDRTVRLWDRHTHLALGPPLRHPTNVLAMAFDNDKRRLATVTRGGVLRIWSIDIAADLQP